MRRRESIAGLGGAVAWPPGAWAQQKAMPVIGYLSSLSPSLTILKPFLQGLSETGYVEGRNVAIEYRWAEGRYDRLPPMAADLVARQVSVIAAGPSPAALAAKVATTQIPIVFAVGADPVQVGLVAKLNKPDGNLTGSSFFTVGLTTKRFQLLLEVVPRPAIVALLVNPASENAEVERKVVQAAAAELGRSVQVLNASDEGDIDAAFAALAREGATALLVGNDPFFFTRRNQLAALAARYTVPAIYPLQVYAAIGGLMSYGTDPNDSSRLQGIYVGRILNGETPVDLPVQQPTKFELVINLKTARTLGLEIPPTLLALADEVIE